MGRRSAPGESAQEGGQPLGSLHRKEVSPWGVCMGRRSAPGESAREGGQPLGSLDLVAAGGPVRRVGAGGPGSSLQGDADEDTACDRS